MAPKSLMKRPAARTSRQAEKKSVGRTSGRSSVGQTSKKPGARTRRSDPEVTTKAQWRRKLSGIASGLRAGRHALGEHFAPNHALERTLEVLDLAAKGTSYSEAAFVVLGEVLKNMDEQLQSTVCEEQAKIDARDVNVNARVDAQAAAKARVVELKKDVSDARLVQVSASESATAAQDRIAIAQAEQVKARTELKELFGKRGKLESAKRDLEPLSDTAAYGACGQKKMRSLRNVGKEFGFHDVLLGALPAVLKKQPERRQTFDSLTLRQLEVEFTKHGSTVDALLVKGEAAAEMRLVAVDEAEEAAHVAAELLNDSSRACAEAESALRMGKEASVAARQHVCAFGSDMRLAKRNLEKSMLQLSAFRSGPLAVFEVMRSEVYDDDRRDQGDYPAADMDIQSEHIGNLSVAVGNCCGDAEDVKEVSATVPSLSPTVPDEDAERHAEELARLLAPVANSLSLSQDAHGDVQSHAEDLARLPGPVAKRVCPSPDAPGPAPSGIDNGRSMGKSATMKNDDGDEGFGTRHASAAW